MSRVFIVRRPNRTVRSFGRGSLTSLCGIAAAVAVIAALGLPSAHASAIYGTLSNFDIYNTTPEPSEGAEIELEGIHSSDIGGGFPAHYGMKSILEYTDASNNFAGTRITYTGYNFPGAPTPGSLLPTINPPSTNGHQLTYSAGGEHFGFWLNGAQPTAQRFFWLNNNAGSYERIGNLPEMVPGPTWTYVPPANPGGAPVLQAAIQVPVPEPEDAPNLRPDSTWMKIFKTKLAVAPENDQQMQELLEKLISGDPIDPNYAGIAPQSEIETESDWELLDGGKLPKERMHEDELGDNDKVVVRRYEFYKYIGAVNEDNEPISVWEDLNDPFHDPGMDKLDEMGNVIFTAERGDFISANMVAAVLGAAVPEPSTLLLGLASVGALLFKRRR